MSLSVIDDFRGYLKYRSGLQPYIWRLKNKFNLYEQEIPERFKRVLQSLKEEDRVIDLGANIGFYTSVFAWSGAKVFSYEPDPRAFEILNKNCSAFSNVELRQAAVGASNGTRTLFYHRADKGNVLLSESSTLVEGKVTASDHNGTIVQVDSIEKCLDDAGGSIALIKMDIEGAELEVLPKLLDEKILHNIGSIWVETHEEQFPSKSAEFKELAEQVRRFGKGKVDLTWH